MSRCRPQSSIWVPSRCDGYPNRKSANGAPDPGESELEVKIWPKVRTPVLPRRLSYLARRTSAPTFQLCDPRAMLTVTAHWKRFSTFRLGVPPPQPLNCSAPMFPPEDVV